MSNNQILSRLFGNGCGCGNLFDDNRLIIILVIGAILLLGDNIFDWLFCNDMSLIWIVLIILLLTNFDDGCCC